MCQNRCSEGHGHNDITWVGSFPGAHRCYKQGCSFVVEPENWPCVTKAMWPPDVVLATEGDDHLLIALWLLDTEKDM